jgi:mannitol-specific phosphotransferase system IIBC component
MTPDSELPTLQQRARRAYELGRLRAAARSALLLAGLGALASRLLIGPRSMGWAALTFALWLVLGWRGGALLRGARYGLVAGAATLLLPLSLLRPCCRWDASGMASCTMPEMCVALGALVALPLSALVLTRREPRQLQLASGVWLGVVSLAAFKCSALFMGEALGLLAGLALGMAVASAFSLLGAQPRRA